LECSQEKIFYGFLKVIAAKTIAKPTIVMIWSALVKLPPIWKEGMKNIINLCLR